MRVFLSADMEGITGVCHRDHLLAGNADYERARRWLTSDVNAAVQGAVDGGATEIVVADGHATMRNVLLDELHPAAQLLCGPANTRNRQLVQLAGLEPDRFDRAMLVGYHTRAGTPGGLLSHTWVGAAVHEIRLQGQPAGEALLNAAILGHYGIPVVFATGADDFEREVKADLGDDLEVAVVKRTLGPTGVISLSLAAATERIRAGAARAMKAERAPLKTAAPVRVELDFHRREMRDQGAEMAGVKVGERTLVFEGESVPAAVEQLWRAVTHALREESGFLK
jgi:D-amino peptidase